MDKPICPKCGSSEIEQTNSFVSIEQPLLIECGNCGSFYNMYVSIVKIEKD